MRATPLDGGPGRGRSYAVVFDKGDELAEGMRRFARDHDLDAASLTAIGALANAVLGYFDRERNEYLEIPVEDQVELLSLVGDIARDDDGPAVHAHVVVGLRDGTTRGGHLLRAEVWPTVELIVTEAPAHLAKTIDRETGLALIDLGRTERPAAPGRDREGAG
jgi:uncharacterized protein